MNSYEQNAKQSICGPSNFGLHMVVYNENILHR